MAWDMYDVKALKRVLLKRDLQLAKYLEGMNLNRSEYF